MMNLPWLQSLHESPIAGTSSVPANQELVTKERVTDEADDLETHLA